jgi:hypothetical protein
MSSEVSKFPFVIGKKQQKCDTAANFLRKEESFLLLVISSFNRSASLLLLLIRK